VTAHAFREDLYYRLNIIHLVVPPLRDRPEDIPAFVAHFLEHFSRVSHVTPPRMAEEALALLTAYSWPDNVRDLAKVIERLVGLRGASFISSADLPIHIAQGLAWPAPMMSCRGPCRSTM
jgi:two-component system response regulator AtoC